jgi:mono/diheme cytochrome c family protein
MKWRDETLNLFPVAALALGAAVFGCIGNAKADDAQVQRGAYLTSILPCNDCHTPGTFLGKPDTSRYLGGSEVGFEVPGLGIFYGPNLTPDNETGLGKWTAEQIATAITKGVRPDGRTLAPPMPVESFKHLTHDDALAIAAYLKTLPAVKNKVRIAKLLRFPELRCGHFILARRHLPPVFREFEQRQTVGLGLGLAGEVVILIGDFAVFVRGRHGCTLLRNRNLHDPARAIKCRSGQGRRRASAALGFFRGTGRAGGGSHRNVQRHRGANKRLQRPGVDLVALMKIDGAPDVAFEA